MFDVDTLLTRINITLCDTGDSLNERQMTVVRNAIIDNYIRQTSSDAVYSVDMTDPLR